LQSKAHSQSITHSRPAPHQRNITPNPNPQPQPPQRAQEEDGLVGPEAAALAKAATRHLGGGGSATAAAGGTPFGTSDVHLDVYGSGEDLEAIKMDAAAKGLDFSFFGGRDHADGMMHDYQVGAVRGQCAGSVGWGGVEGGVEGGVAAGMCG